LIARARTPSASQILSGNTRECDLVAKVVIGGRVRDYLMTSGTWNADDDSSNLSDLQLRALSATPGQELTYTPVPPASGPRISMSN
jgi:hypothetical protein